MDTNGACSGFHSLKEPATQTCRAPGFTNSKHTPADLIGGTVLGAIGLTGITVALALLTIGLFNFRGIIGKSIFK
jgi:hypothetical protein